MDIILYIGMLVENPNLFPKSKTDSIIEDIRQFNISPSDVRYYRNVASRTQTYIRSCYVAGQIPDKIGKDLAWIYEAWDTLDDLKYQFRICCQDMEVRERKVRILKSLLGPKNFYAGRMPLPCIYWHFSEEENPDMMGFEPPSIKK